MKRFVFRSGLFALVAACSGSKHADESTPKVAPVAPAGSATQVSDDAASIPQPPIEGSQPSDVPHGALDDESARHPDPTRIAQAISDAGVGGRDAGAPGAPGGPDAGIPGRD